MFQHAAGTGGDVTDIFPRVSLNGLIHEEKVGESKDGIQRVFQIVNGDANEFVFLDVKGVQSLVGFFQFSRLFANALVFFLKQLVAVFQMLMVVRKSCTDDAEDHKSGEEAHDEINSEGFEENFACAVGRLLDDKDPIQLRNVTVIGESSTTGGRGKGDIAHAGIDLLKYGLERFFHFVIRNGGVIFRMTVQHQIALTVVKVNMPAEALIVAVHEIFYRTDRQPHARGANEITVPVQDAVVDENGHRVFIGLIEVNIKLIRRLHLANAEIPLILGIVLADDLDDAVGMVVFEGAVRDEKAADGIVSGLNLIQVACDGGLVGLSFEDPVLHESVIGHEGRDQDWFEKVPLDFGIDVVAGKRQLGFKDGAADRLTGNDIADRAGEHEGCEEQQPQEEEHEIFSYGRKLAQVFIKRHGYNVWKSVLGKTCRPQTHSPGCVTDRRRSERQKLKTAHGVTVTATKMAGRRNVLSAGVCGKGDHLLKSPV